MAQSSIVIITMLRYDISSLFYPKCLVLHKLAASFIESCISSDELWFMRCNICCHNFNFVSKWDCPCFVQRGKGRCNRILKLKKKKLLYFIIIFIIWMMMMAIRIICMIMMIISRPPCEPLTRLKGRKFWDQLAPPCSLDRSSWEVFSFDRLLRNISGDLHLIQTVAWQYLSVASDHDLFKLDRNNHKINLWRFFCEFDLSN